MGLEYKTTDLYNDGGNIVDNYYGKVVMSTKFLKDNTLSAYRARRHLKKLMDVSHIAFIEADELGGLEHADGVVAFIDEHTLLINSYPNDPEYSKYLKETLSKSLPDVAIYEIVTPYDASTIYDEKFGSACGIYTNAVVTKNVVYVPQFGIDEDKIALDTIRNITDKNVIPVDASRVCYMGGSVRCLSWQLNGKNAEKLLAYVHTINSAVE